MASGNLFNISGRDRKQNTISILLSYNYDEPTWHGQDVQSIEFTLTVQSGGAVAVLTAPVDLQNAKVSVVASLTDPLTICLLACAGKALLGPLIDCFNTDVSKYLECLKSKGLSIATDVVTCAAECAIAGP